MIKTDIRNVSKLGVFRGENDSKSAQRVQFFFLLEKILRLKKMRKCYSIFYHKNRNTYQFHAFTIKNDFQNISGSDEFRFREKPYVHEGECKSTVLKNIGCFTKFGNFASAKDL